MAAAFIGYQQSVHTVVPLSAEFIAQTCADNWRESADGRTASLDLETEIRPTGTSRQRRSFETEIASFGAFTALSERVVLGPDRTSRDGTQGDWRLIRLPAHKRAQHGSPENAARFPTLPQGEGEEVFMVQASAANRIRG